jgi:hypothetical protein
VAVSGSCDLCGMRFVMVSSATIGQYWDPA